MNFGGIDSVDETKVIRAEDRPLRGVASVNRRGSGGAENLCGSPSGI